MKQKRNIHTGSDFSSFLKSEGLESEIVARGNKRSKIHQSEKLKAPKALKAESTKKKSGPPGSAERS